MEEEGRIRLEMESLSLHRGEEVFPFLSHTHTLSLSLFLSLILSHTLTSQQQQHMAQETGQTMSNFFKGLHLLDTVTQQVQLTVLPNKTIQACLIESIQFLSRWQNVMFKGCLKLFMDRPQRALPASLHTCCTFSYSYGCSRMQRPWNYLFWGSYERTGQIFFKVYFSLPTGTVCQARKKLQMFFRHSNKFLYKSFVQA